MRRERLAIIDGVRTPFCKMGTALAGLDAVELGRVAVSQLLVRAGLDPALVDEVIFGCVVQPAGAQNIGRVVALRAGIPPQVPAVTVHRNCASGLEVLTTAQQRMLAGAGEVFVVGGAESMSRAPLLFGERAAGKFGALARARGTVEKARAAAGFRAGDFAPVAGLRLGLTDPVSGLNMGETAEVLAREGGISRESQDGFALRSHLNAAAGRERLREEICPVLVGGEAIEEDNGVREGQTLEALGRLKPVFDRRYGTVTAGNSSQITDGAVALLVMSEAKAALLGFEPIGYLEDSAYAGCDPKRMGLGPVYAIGKGCARGAAKPDEADVVELNEAFAAQVLAVQRGLEDAGLGLPEGRTNVNGGAVALGHPVGATGSRLALTALKELGRRGGERALVSLCVGGGQGAAVWLSKH